MYYDDINLSTDYSVYDSLKNQLAGFSLKIESLHFFEILIGTIANGLDPSVLMYMVLPLLVLFHCLNVPNWFKAPLIVLVAF